MAENVIQGDVRVIGNVNPDSITMPVASVSNSAIAADAAFARSKMAQKPLRKFPVPLTDFRVFDALATNLPGTSADDDLALIGGTFATATPSIKTYDIGEAGATDLYARVMITLPERYDDGETVILRVHCGMLTAVADVECTIDAVIYESDLEAGKGADLCATGATNMNSLTLANVDFTITSAGLVAGDTLDVRLHVHPNDAGTAISFGIIGAVHLLCDVK